MSYVESHTNDNVDSLRAYYKWHAPIYDATRWSFLFGRRRLIQNLPELPPQPRILEIGCGTGRNIERLEFSYPAAQIIGIDVSEAMLKKASQKVRPNNHVTLLHERYGTQKMHFESPDLVLLSYSLTMMDDEAEQILQQVMHQIPNNGYIAVVDFHQTPFRWFRRWMRSNHVLINGSLLPLLKKYYTPVQCSVHSAYLGLWSYFHFIGRHS